MAFTMKTSDGDDPSEEFREFADDIEELRARVPSAIEDGIEDTAMQLKEKITEKIQKKGTSKGGTLDSRTSPYSPGGENDSSTDGLHIADESAWNHRKTQIGQFRVFPNPKVRDRAKFIEYGTTDHGPDGEIPMYFDVGGMTIVMSDAHPEASLGERFDAEPTEVEGVEPQRYFMEAVQELRAEDALRENIARRLQAAAQESIYT